MRKILSQAILTAGVLAASVTASAQVYGGPYNNSGGYYRDGYRTDGYYRDGYQTTVVDQVRADLDRMLSRASNNNGGGYGYGYGGNNGNMWEVRALAAVQRDLASFQASYANGRFDMRPLDQATSRLARLVNSPNLRDWQRQRLANHLQLLQDFRNSAGNNNGYSPYGYNGYGYRR